jgi:ubiquinone/menaquinone biosynthesis C-methylase UbiE
VALDSVFSDFDLAALYDIWHPPHGRADFDFYHPMIMAAGSVLDVGCGTGAMLHRAREAGHTGRLCGLDPAAGMLAQARRRADIEWVEGDLALVAWLGAFDLIVMTGHAFQVLIDDDDISAALHSVHRTLTDDGRFAFETRNPAARAWEKWTPEHAVEITDGAGAAVRITTEIVGAFDGRTVSFTHTFNSSRWPEPQISRSTLRFTDMQKLSSLLTDAGLAIDRQYGDWSGDAFGEDSPEIITLAHRA